MKDDSPKAMSNISRRTRSSLSTKDQDSSIPKKKVKLENVLQDGAMGNWKVCTDTLLMKPPDSLINKNPRDNLRINIVSRLNNVLDSSKNVSCDIFDELNFLQSGQSILSINKRKSSVIEGDKQEKTYFASDDSDSEPEYWSCEEILNRVKAEHKIINKIKALKKSDSWGLKILAKKPDPPKPMCHWDYLLKEMKWFHDSRNQEKLNKKRDCKNIAAHALKYVKEKEVRLLKLSKEETVKAKKHCSLIAKMVKDWWKQMEKIVLAKHKFRIDARRQEAINTHLEKVMETTEKYTEWLTEDLKQGNMSDTMSTEDPEYEIEKEDERDHIISEDESDDVSKSHKASSSSSDLEEGEVNEELESLVKQNEQCLDDILNELPPEYLQCITGQKEEEIINQSETQKEIQIDSPVDDKEEGECDDSDDGQVQVASVDEEDEDEDDEKTLAEQEKHENISLSCKNDTNNNENSCKIDDTVQNELNELHEDANLPIEELLEKYKKLYSADSINPENLETVEDNQSLDSDVEDDSSSSYSESNKESDTSSENEQVNLLEELVLDKDVKSDEKTEDNKLEGKFSEIADLAISTQPLGFTLESTEVKVQIPFLLKHSLREYQHVGLDWLAAIYEKRLNGVLADEMGLGKTIQTISLLGYLACEKGIWGPHLIIVPTSVILNWELELKKWCPGFKILTYYGTNKERVAKRKGWTKPNAFHVCITSYKLAIQDNAAFKRKKWKYMILDEAQNIKNFKSQRWQTLLTFNSQRRLLLTGTPLQNNLMELWSLMHFLMPNIFQSHREFNDWFGNPLSGMIEGSKEYNEQLILRLHKVLRPFILRRLKKDVEKQLPQKIEHVVMCPLSKRQRFLYDDFMSLTSTKETLASGQFMSIINILMQLRKVCNHPNLFEERPVTSPFIIGGNNCLHYNVPKLSILENVYNQPVFTSQPRTLSEMASNLPSFVSHRIKGLTPRPGLIEEIDSIETMDWVGKYKDKYGNIDHEEVSHQTDTAFISRSMTEYLDNLDEPITSSIPLPKPVVFGHKIKKLTSPNNNYESNSDSLPKIILDRRQKERQEMFKEVDKRNRRTCSFLSESYLGPDLVDAVQIRKKNSDHMVSYKEVVGRMWEEQLMHGYEVVKRSICTTLPVITRPVIINTTSSVLKQTVQQTELMYSKYYSSVPNVSMQIRQNLLVQFPETRLIEYDCGKLQVLVTLLNRLKSEGHRCLIFTQMTRMLDVLEQFLSYHGYKYVRLDGTTKVEQRQMLMERFNKDDRIFVFILSTRSGGVGVNLTGADTVIFYDSDWNPTMDAQAQDRCHRIGQTRDVHIYRLISSRTVEENILKKANEKRCLSEMAIEGGQFNMTYFKNNNATSDVGTNNESGGLFEDIFQNPTGFIENSEAENSNVDNKPIIENNKNEYKSRKGRRIKWKGEKPPPIFNQSNNVDIKIDESELSNVKINQLELEAALEQAEEESDRMAAKTLRAETTAELAEFDESVPWIDESSNGGGNEDAAEKFRNEMELQLQNLNKQLDPLQRYGVKWLELTNEDTLVDELQNEETQIESNKHEWQLDQIKALHEDDEIKKDTEEDDMMYVSGGFDPYAAQRQELEKLKYEDLLLEYQQEQALLNDSSSVQTNNTITPNTNIKRQRPPADESRGQFGSGRRGRKRMIPRSNISLDVSSHQDSLQSINLPESTSRNNSIDYSSDFSDNVPLKIACTPPYQSAMTFNASSENLVANNNAPVRKLKRGRPRGSKNNSGSQGNSSQNSPGQYQDSLFNSDENSRDSSYIGGSVASFVNGTKSDSFHFNNYNSMPSNDENKVGASLVRKANDITMNGVTPKPKRGRPLGSTKSVNAGSIRKLTPQQVNNTQYTRPPIRMQTNPIRMQTNPIRLQTNPIRMQTNPIRLPNNVTQPRQSQPFPKEQLKIPQINANPISIGPSSSSLYQNQVKPATGNHNFKIPVKTLTGEHKLFSAPKLLSKTKPVFLVSRQIEKIDPNTGLSEVFTQNLTYPVEQPSRYVQLSNIVQQTSSDAPTSTNHINLPLNNYVESGQLRFVSTVRPSLTQNPRPTYRIPLPRPNFSQPRPTNAPPPRVQFFPRQRLPNDVSRQQPRFLNGYGAP